MDIIREDCIYARQSVDRKDSISIESQIDFCKYEFERRKLPGIQRQRIFRENTDRPEFQKLLEKSERKVRRVIVYKLTVKSVVLFSTSQIRWELFQEYDVEFVSSTEKNLIPRPRWAGQC